LYRLVLTVDANFRLKNKDKKVVNDIALGDGFGHWVPNQPYAEYLGTYGYQEEVRYAKFTHERSNVDVVL
jgi:hypothetical protein